MRLNVRWLFLLAGLVLVLSAVVIDYAFISETAPGEKLGNQAKDFFLAIGVSVLAVSLVDYLWSKVGGDPLSAEIKKFASLNDLMADSSKTGISRVHAKAQTSEIKNWKALIERAQKNIDLTGYQMLDIVDSDAAMNALAQKASNGVTVRVLLMPATSIALNYAVSPQYLEAMRGIMKHALMRFQAWHKSLPEGHRCIIATVNESSVLDASVRRFDNHMCVVHYLQAINTSDTPVFELVDNGNEENLFKTYEKWFNQMFDNAARL